MNAQPAAQAEAAAVTARFINNGDGTVTDTTTGLMWSGTLECGKVDHAAAEKQCSELSFAGHSDWRLPTVEELFALADRARHGPAIDTEAFPDTKSYWYWTSTAWSPNPSACAWFVYFGDGYADYGNRGVEAFVRAVRVAPAGQ